MTTSAPTQSPLQSVLTLFAFLVIISIGLWGAITAFKLFPRMSEVFSSFFTRSTESAIVITSDLSIPSGTEYALNWEHNGDDSGVYAFSYDCTDGVSVEAPVAAGGVLGPITCGISYGVPGTERSLTIVPKSTATAQMPIALSYTTSAGEKTAVATSTITITTAATSTPVTTPVATPTTQTPITTQPITGTLPAPAPSVASPADLEPTLIAIGVEDPYSGAFIPQTQFVESDVVVVKFSVKNRGGRATGAWSFTAELPTNPPYYYEAPSQRSLNPGDWNEFTLRFNQAAGGSIFINIDAADAVKEANKNNNTLTIDVPQYWY
jgi:hypothetical protein